MSSIKMLLLMADNYMHSTLTQSFIVTWLEQQQFSQSEGSY